VAPTRHRDWKPQNYDHKFHGQVPLQTALAHSYNVSTARLGIELGVDHILDKLPKFGIERDRRLLPHPCSAHLNFPRSK